MVGWPHVILACLYGLPVAAYLNSIPHDRLEPFIGGAFCGFVGSWITMRVYHRLFGMR